MTATSKVVRSPFGQPRGDGQASSASTDNQHLVMTSRL